MIKRGINVHDFLEGHGIRCLPVRQARDPRPPNTIYGGRTVARMLRRLGPVRTGLVVSCIMASRAPALYGDVLYAVSLFIGAHRPGADPAALRSEFAALDLDQLRRRAQRLSLGQGGPMAAKAKALATLIASELLAKDAAA